jgi:hypothetical protein
MSWDIVLFNLSNRVQSVEEISDQMLVNIGSGMYFKQLITEFFPDAICKDDWCAIEFQRCSIQFSFGKLDEYFSSKLIHLYGERAIYPILDLCRKFGWQIFDTGSGKMIDIKHPETNGFKEFES